MRTLWVTLILSLPLGPFVRPAASAPESPRPKAPRWSLDALRGSLQAIAGAGRFSDVARKDAALALAMAKAYGVSPTPGESTLGLASRTLRTRRPHHPPIASEQVLTALARQYYEDLAARSAALARFEKNRKIRDWLSARSVEAEGAAQTLAGELEIELPGLEGFVGLPPEVTGGRAPGVIGARAEVVGAKLVIERLPRATFRGALPEADAPRTAGGALREVRAALKQFDTTASMLGRYDSKWRKRRGRVHFIAPASAPAGFLRELARAGRSAGVKTISVVVLNLQGQIRVLPLGLKGKAKRSVPVECPPELSMQDCAKNIARASRSGRPVLAL